MPRARQLGVPFHGETGPLNAITDVAGVHVGHTTLIEGENVRTGVTAILPRGAVHSPVFAGYHSLNGNGEMTGTIWIEESGFLEGPVMITNTHSVGVVRDAVIAWTVERKLYHPIQGDVFWSLPVVAETYDGTLNDVNGFHIAPAHVFAALDGASTGPVAEGAVGGGTGMICHDFKGGIGTSSRRLSAEEGGYTVGVLVQANYGRRRHLTIAGVPVKDTIKKAREGVITETVDREGLWMIQTPQAFRYELLMEAAQRAKDDGFLGTDEAMLVERMGHPVKIVESTYENVKMTTPDDLIYGKAILASRLQEE